MWNVATGEDEGWMIDYTNYTEPENYVEIDATASTPANQSQINNDSWADANGYSFQSVNNFLGNLFSTVSGAISGVQGVNKQIQGTQATNSAGAVTATSPLIRTSAQTQNDKLIQSLVIAGLIFFAFKKA